MTVLTAAEAGPGTVRTARARALCAPLGAAGAVAAATVALNRTGGHDLGPLATCWFHAGTGLYCPFCGSLRGVAALSHGDVLTALHDNAPVMLLLGVATLIWGRRILFAFAGKTVERTGINGLANMSLAAFFLVFTIYRNTPYGAWLAPLS
ncbi:MAG TPA: DUF2752 domain-containing protein [Dermatophilaceae bacterium]|nr:DUF2752 domain-containing protein [Dermatophilaceae bacterium]